MDSVPHPFTNILMAWHKENARDLPWKHTNDPYKIWLSEIILQQTRVQQGTPYYNRFVKEFPNVQSLAEASEDKVLKLWEGLGYYSRARNLHAAAKSVVNDWSGKFPDTFEDLLSLKGVGEYTAAAIASFAFNLPLAVVDGNVIRVLSRYLGIKDPVDAQVTKKRIKFQAQGLLHKNNPGGYNQAIMDFGSTVCTPNKPVCCHCPLSSSCIAFANNTVKDIPFKAKRIKKKTRYFNYHIYSDKNRVLIKKRRENDIWKGLYDFHLVESDDIQLLATNQINSTFESFVSDIKPIKSIGPFTHLLTHQRIVASFHFYKTRFNNNNSQEVIEPFYLVEKKKLSTFAFPRLIQRQVIDKKAYE